MLLHLSISITSRITVWSWLCTGKAHQSTHGTKLDAGCAPGKQKQKQHEATYLCTRKAEQSTHGMRIAGGCAHGKQRRLAAGCGQIYIYRSTHAGIQLYSYWHTGLLILAYRSIHAAIQVYSYWHTALHILAYCRSTHATESREGDNA